MSHCSACGTVHEGREHCDIGRLCFPCRARAGNARKVRFSAAQDRVLREAKRAQLDRGKYRFTVRHMTLTVPHRESSANATEREVDGPYATAARRVGVLFRAWRHFSLAMQEWAREVRNLTGQRVEWYRSFEWTPAGADDGMGHPHFHVWNLCPYPPRGEQSIAEWWSAALAREEVYISPDRVIVGLREAPDASDRPRGRQGGRGTHRGATARRHRAARPRLGPLDPLHRRVVPRGQGRARRPPASGARGRGVRGP